MNLLTLAQETIAYGPHAKGWLYAGFVAFVLVMLALDLGVFNKKAHVVSTSEALRWTGVCVALALLFTGVVYYIYEHHWLGIGVDVPQLDGSHASTDGAKAAFQFLTGYVIEYSLSLDNIFIIALIFAHFAVKPEHQHRVLFWGILGALLMRGGMIAAGGALVARFNWIIFIFGGFLILTGVKMMSTTETDFDAEQNIVVRWARKVYPVSATFDGQRFFTRLSDGRRAMTPMFLALLVVEFTDLIFAVDSIPAIFAVTLDPFIVFTSNVFAILGLRSLYFALAGLMGKFRYLKTSLALVLIFVGGKMLLAKFVHMHPAVSLGVVAAVLAGGVIASLLIPDTSGKSTADGAGGKA